MTDKEFARLYLGEFPAREEAFKRAYEAWLAYYTATEEYDKKRCHRWIDGVARPTTVEEGRDCTANAFAQYRRYLTPIGKETPPEVWRQAQTDALQYHEYVEKQKRRRPSP